jgi:hypothetical protein
MGAGGMAEYPGIWPSSRILENKKINVENKENLPKK